MLFNCKEFVFRLISLFIFWIEQTKTKGGKDSISVSLSLSLLSSTRERRGWDRGVDEQKYPPRVPPP